jgi:WhiB family redox-sensing transcriptional regulator
LHAVRWEPIDTRSDPEQAAYLGDPQLLLDVDVFVQAVTSRPAWMADAACREHPEVSFHPGQGEDQSPAKVICDGCLVRAECLAMSLQAASRSDFGIWGGTSAIQRSRLRATNPTRTNVRLRATDRPTTANARGAHRAPRGPGEENHWRRQRELVALVSSTPEQAWSDRRSAWNEAHPEHPFHKNGPMANAYRLAARRVGLAEEAA